MTFSAFAAYMLSQISSWMESSWILTDGISLRVSFIERRLMGLEFSPWEVQRQIANCISEWDMTQDNEYGSRQCFQFLARYSRNFLQRTHQRPSALALSIIANKAIEESGEDRTGAKIQALLAQLQGNWTNQFHNQGNVYNPQASVVNSGQALTEEEKVDFYGFQ